MSVAIGFDRPFAPFARAAAARALPVLVALTALCGLTYVSVQQSHRQTANDPQLQLAGDAARALAAGAPLQTVVPPKRVNLAASLAPWVTVVDGRDRALASNALLDGAVPALPPGVLAAARARRENRVTWQPRADVRSATVSVAVPGRDWVVTAGRSLREVEAREGLAQLYALAVWLAGCAGVIAAAIVAEWIGAR